MVKKTNTPTHLNNTLKQKCSGVLFLRRGRLSGFASCMEFAATPVRLRARKNTYADWE